MQLRSALCRFRVERGGSTLLAALRAMQGAIFGGRHTDGQAAEAPEIADVALQGIEVHLDRRERQFYRNAEAMRKTWYTPVESKHER